LDQQALTDWIEAQLDREAAALEVKRQRTGIPHPHDPLASGRRNAYKLVLGRMRRGNLPEIDNVERLISEFSAHPGLRGGASQFRQGQDDALAAIRAKATELMK
jgi:hypothetical protein